MKLNKKSLEQLIKEELEYAIKEGWTQGQMGRTVHPFDNEMANQPDIGPQENVYEELANAAIMEMMSVYNEEEVRKIIRFLVDKASQGPTGLGGRFTDEQIEEILLLVFEKVEEKTGVKLASHLPQDREHPKYMDLD